MTDNELLLSISQIMDKKLDPLEKRMDTFEEKLDKLDAKIDRVEQNLNTKIDLVQQNLNTVEQNLNAKIDLVEQSLKHSIHLINLTLDNNIVPRLNEIESCYISTSERYLKETDKIIALDTDLSVAKSVILEHRKKLAALGAYKKLVIRPAFHILFILYLPNKIPSNLRKKFQRILFHLFRECTHNRRSLKVNHTIEFDFM